MLRSTSRVLALLAAMTVPAVAADYSDDWGDDYEDAPEFRESSVFVFSVLFSCAMRRPTPGRSSRARRRCSMTDNGS